MQHARRSRTGGSWTALLCVLLALLAWPVVAGATLTPLEDDGRLVIYSDSLEVIRGRAGVVDAGPSWNGTWNTTAPAYPPALLIYDYCRTRPGGPTSLNGALIFAAAYRYFGNTTWGDQAKTWGLSNLSAAEFLSGEGGGPGSMHFGAFWYSAVRDRMTAGERAAVLAYVQGVGGNVLDNLVNDVRYAPQDYSFSLRVAFAGEAGLVAGAQAALDDCLVYIEDECLPCIAQWAPVSGFYYGYVYKRITSLVLHLETLRNAFGVDLITPNLAQLRRMGDAFALMIRTDGQVYNTATKFNATQGQVTALLGWFGSRCGSKLAQAVCEEQIALARYSITNAVLDHTLASVYILAWWDPYATSADLDRIDQKRTVRDTTRGMLFTRTGLDYSTSSTDVQRFVGVHDISDGPLGGYLSTAYGRSWLLGKSEFYESQDNSRHFGGFAKRTGRARLEIVQPGESFGTFQYVDSNCPDTGGFASVPNWGQATEEDLAGAQAAWGLCNPGAGFTRSGFMEWADTTATYSDTQMDLSAQWKTSKATSHFRRITTLYPGLDLVQDRVVLAAAGLTPRQTIPLANVPAVVGGGTLTTVRGTTWADGSIRGGVFTYPWDPGPVVDVAVTMTNAPGMVQLFPLRGEAVGSSARHVRVIGGVSRLADPTKRRWRHSHVSCALLYTADPFDQGYECFNELDGINWTPSHNLTFGTGANSDTTAAGRHNEPRMLCDARVELTMEAAGAGETNLAHLLYTAPAGTALADVRWNTADDRIVFAALTAGAWDVASVGEPGTVRGAESVTIANPIADVDASATWRAFDLEPAVSRVVYGDGTPLFEVTTDASGTATWQRNLVGVASIEVGPPTPGTSEGEEYVVSTAAANDMRYVHARHYLRAGDGQMLAGLAITSGLDTEIYAARSADAGRTWYLIDSDFLGAYPITPVGEDAPQAGTKFYPRAGAGWSWCIEPFTQDLIVAVSSERRNASQVVQATLVRIHRYHRTGNRWSLTPDATTNQTEFSGSTLPTSVVCAATASGRVYVSWTQRSGSAYLTRTALVRKGQTSLELTASSTTTSPLQWSQLVEAPRGTLNRLRLTRVGTEDYIYVASLTDGPSPSWGAETVIPFAVTSAPLNGEWSAAAVGSTLHVVARNTDAIAWVHLYGSPSNWRMQTLTGLGSRETPSLAATVDGRLVCTLQYVSSGDGRVECQIHEAGVWSAAADVWTGEDVQHPHLVAIDGTTCRLMAWSDGATDYARTKEFAIPGPSGEPATGACCLAHVCTIETELDCTGVWYGAGTICSPSPCPPPPPGACCIAGVCSQTTEAGCAGDYLGDGVACSPDPCPDPPSGACCVGFVCSVTTAADCAGTWYGAETTCAPSPCPVPPGHDGRRRRVLMAGNR